jgi:hypothetical protein
MRLVRSSTSEFEWEGVSDENPCPICGARSICRLHDDERFACCLQRPSEWPLTNGGWLHRLSREIVSITTPADRPPTATLAGVES